MKKIHAGIVEVAVANLFNYRQNHIVPNVSFGWGLRHEADLIVVTPKLYVTEVEIKVSKADLMKDFEKGHGHESRKIHRLVYAVPKYLQGAAEAVVPSHCGIIVVSERNYGGSCLPTYEAQWLRNARHDKAKPPITEKALMELLRLAAMRIWSLKEHNNKMK